MILPLLWGEGWVRGNETLDWEIGSDKFHDSKTHELQRTPEGVPDAVLPVWKLGFLCALEWSGIPPGCKRIVAL